MQRLPVLEALLASRRTPARRSSVTVSRFVFSPAQQWCRPRALVFLHFALTLLHFALDSDPREPVQLVAAPPNFGRVRAA